ncbi:hypothetical protein [Streptomyces flaveolus]|uniref:hypothetical protein n=1 Tax=Streptomyces flaveolus TaxID=67297 RepID=UPI0036F6AB2B
MAPFVPSARRAGRQGTVRPPSQDDGLGDPLRTPDADGDGIPDMWAVMGSDVARFYPGGAQVHGTPVEIVSASDGVGWHNKKAIG